MLNKLPGNPDSSKDHSANIGNIRPAQREAGADNSDEARFDQELVERVRQAGRDSGLKLSLESRLRELGVGTLLKFHKNKMLFKRLEMLQIFVDLPPPRNFRENVRSLVFLAVHSCSGPFIEKYVFDGKWDPTKASLRTCFVNGSLIAFGREYRRFRNQETRHYGKELLRTEEDDADDADGSDLSRYYSSHPYPDPLQRVIEWEEFVNLLSVCKNPIDNLIIRRTAQNFSQKEIAEELGLTEEAVSSRIRRARQKIKGERRVEG